MKLKADFITNSSSTAFIFIFKGDSKIQFYRTLVGHKKIFKLKYEKEQCDVWDVIESMDPHIRMDIGDNKDFWYKPGIQPIEILKNLILNGIAQTEESINSSKMSTYSKSLLSNIQLHDYRTQLSIVENAILNGFTHYLDMDFGNDGTISTQPICDIMDYRGRKIRIEEKDLIIFTEQRR